MHRTVLRFLVALSTALQASGPAVAEGTPAPRAWMLEGQSVYLRMPWLEASAVTAIAQDPQGFLWFGTQSNLLRWDGYRLRTYVQNPELPGSLPDNFIRSLLVDEKGHLWVGTNSGGISRYEPQTDAFVSIPVGPGGTRDGQIPCLAADRRGGLWIGTGTGLEHLDGATGRVDSDNQALPRGSISALLVAHDGALWVGTRKGLLRRPQGQADFQPVPVATTEGPTPVISALKEDHAGRVWIGTNLSGAFVLDPGADQLRRLMDGPSSSNPVLAGISTITEVNQKEIWLGTSEDGIVRVNLATWTTRLEKRDLARSRSLPSNQIDSLFIDRDGFLWIGTRAALSRTDPNQHLIQTFYGGSGPGLLLDDESISSLMAIPDGRVWVGLTGGGLAVVDPVLGRVARLYADAENPDHALPKPQVIAMARAPDGSVFLGTSAGLYRADANAHGVARLQIPMHKKTTDVRSLLMVDDHLWVGSLDGLYELGLAPGGALELLRLWDSELGDTRVRTLARGPDGGVWIGTPTGVSHIDPKTNAVVRLPNEPRNPAALPGGYISSMLTDRHGRLWVATFGRGIQVEQGRNGAGMPIFRRLSEHDGLPQNSVDELLMDNGGNVWASTDGGLARIDPERLEVRAFRTGQGVGIDGFFTGTGDVTPAGELLFGGLTGLLVVHPDELGPGNAVPGIAITDAHVSGHDIAPSQALFHDGLQVDARDRSLTVEFTALDYVDPELRRYSYRLTGFDQEWNETPATRRLASYTNLPPGDYALQLRTAAADGRWSKPVELPVHVQPAWYQYGAVQALGAALLLSLVLGVVQMRTLVLRRRHRELERLVADRTAELQRSQEYLQKMAYFDALTGLPNRRMFNDHLRRLIASRQRGYSDFALLLIDLDRFKAINDSFGHDVGDGLLVAVAGILNGLIRETDLAARLGGDEFGVILAQPRDEAAIEKTCARIIRKLREPIGVAHHCLLIGASIGIAAVPDDGATPDELYKSADLALYEAKKAGRNTWRWGTRPDTTRPPPVTVPGVAALPATTP